MLSSLHVFQVACLLLQIIDSLELFVYGYVPVSYKNLTNLTKTTAKVSLFLDFVILWLYQQVLRYSAVSFCIFPF